MTFIPTKETPLREILSHYINTISINKKSYKSEIYRIKALNDLLGDIPLGGITSLQVSAFRDKRLATINPKNNQQPLKGSTVNRELVLLSHVFTVASTDWGMDDLFNPVARVRKPKPPPGRARRLTPAEERKLISAAARHSNKCFFAIIVLALESAMRQGEILSLRWENIHWQKRIVHLPNTKNGDPRDVPLSRKAYEILHDYMQRKTNGLIFGCYTSDGLKSAWRCFIKRIGIEDFHFHDLRHCAISSLLERGLNTIEVAAISGHKSMSMLKRYAHLSSWRLVEKLDPKPRAKKYRAILKEQLYPYPAVITQYKHRVDVDFPDFINMQFSGEEENTVVENAKNTLLRTVVTYLCDGKDLPIPSSTEVITTLEGRSKVIMISPI